MKPDDIAKLPTPITEATHYMERGDSSRRLEQDRAALIEALEWYANRDHWITSTDLKTSKFRAGDAWELAEETLAAVERK